MGKVVFTVFDYLEDVIVECTEDLVNSYSYCPGNNQIIKVVGDSPKFPPKDTELFHHYFIRLLFASKRARPDIQVYVTFLCIQVRSPKKQDYINL